MEQITFKTHEFEGPLDLLLFLIKANKVNIYDIPIVEISEQYIKYVNEMKEMDLDYTSEFLVMASELLYIKSKMLLPVEKNDDGEVIDPRTELVAKLLEYQKYKELSEFLKEREDIGRFSFVKPRAKVKGIKYNNDDLDVSLVDLVNAFQDVVDRIERKLPPPKTSFVGIVAREEVNLKDRIDIILKHLSKNKKVEFDELFITTCTTRPQIIVTFLGVLELIKLSKITVKKYGDNMYITLKEEK
ncbi:MAG: segregation/condensation protein A [Clostridia bacterium]|nr:segregation/condensation protein A [Clostridia bacterium]